MIRAIHPYRAGDSGRIAAHPAFRAELPEGMSPHRLADSMASNGGAFTFSDGTGAIVMIAGLMPVCAGYAYAWAIPSEGAGRHMLWLTRAVRSYLDRHSVRLRRIEMTVRASSGAAIRWAEMLGFVKEAEKPLASHDGGAMLVFVRLNEEARP